MNYDSKTLLEIAVYYAATAVRLRTVNQLEFASWYAILAIRLTAEALLLLVNERQIQDNLSSIETMVAGDKE